MLGIGVGLWQCLLATLHYNGGDKKLLEQLQDTVTMVVLDAYYREIRI